MTNARDAGENLAEALLRAGRSTPAKIAIRVRGESDRRDVAYGELERDVRRFAGALRAAGVVEEQRILLALPDGPELLIAFLGAIWNGSVPVLVNPFLRADDHRFFLENSRARRWVTTPELAEAIAEQGVDVPALTVGPGGAGTFRDAVASGTAIEHPFPNHADDAAFWLYSSGTTGRPKGTIHLHRNPIAAIAGYGASILETSHDDVSYATSKLFFAYGLGASLYFPLAAGATVVLVPDPFQPARSWQILAEERPTLFFSVPSAYRALVDHAVPDPRAAAASVRRCLSAGEGLPPKVFEDWRSATGHEILDGIGSTEMLHIYLSNRPGDARAGTLGSVVPGYEVEIVDDEGRHCPPGEPGVMRVRGASMAAGYWQRLEATRRAFRGEWYDSGDQAVEDPDGRYRIVGRADDMLKVSGQWVAPVDVEAIVATVPGVRECAVVGRSAANGLIELVVCIAAAESDRPSIEAALAERCASSLPRYKRPKAIHWMDAFPRTATGKLQRFRLREELSSQRP